MVSRPSAQSIRAPPQKTAIEVEFRETVAETSWESL